MISLAVDLVGVRLQDPDHPVDLGSVEIDPSAAIHDPVNDLLLTLCPIWILLKAKAAICIGSNATIVRPNTAFQSITSI